MPASKPIADQIALAAARHVISNVIIPGADCEPAPPCMIESATVDINNCCLRCGAADGEECGEN